MSDLKSELRSRYAEMAKLLKPKEEDMNYLGQRDGVGLWVKTEADYTIVKVKGTLCTDRKNCIAALLNTETLAKVMVDELADVAKLNDSPLTIYTRTKS